jgi:hypothetical protein
MQTAVRQPTGLLGSGRSHGLSSAWDGGLNPMQRRALPRRWTSPTLARQGASHGVQGVRSRDQKGEVFRLCSVSCGTLGGWGTGRRWHGSCAANRRRGLGGRWAHLQFSVNCGLIIYLAWLATGMEQCRTVDIRVLCGIFNTSVEDMMQYYRVKDHVNKSELIARIQTTAGGLQ